MKILVIGDVYGKKGRKLLSDHLPQLQKLYTPDYTIVNSENICHGHGPKLKHIQFLENLDVDIMTGGNHTLYNKDNIADYLNQEDTKQLRPHNFYDSDTPGKGWQIVEKDGSKILVLNVISSVFMRDHVDNPFLTAEKLIQEHGSGVDAIVVDFHKETTSEGYAMARFLDGRTSLVYGTHTHVQSNDEQVFPLGTGFINDVGFCGAAQSIIGVEWESIQSRFTSGMQHGKMRPDELNPGVLNGLLVEIQDKKCIHIEKIRIREDEK